MTLPTRTLLTLIGEAALESKLVKDLESFDVPGWTISDVRGRGSRGVRRSAWDNEGNIRVEVICSTVLAERLLEHVRDHYHRDFAIICFLSEVQILREEKF